MGIKTVTSNVGGAQFIRAAQLSRALASSFREVTIHTSQHYDYGISDVLFEEMERKKPDFNLGMGGDIHGEQDWGE